MRRRAVLARLLVYGGLSAALLGWLPDALLYQPSRHLPDAIALRAAGLAPWPSADDYRGLLREPAGVVRGTVLLFHGNAGQAADRAYLAERLGAIGLRVLIAEYPGYGSRPGSPGEAAWIADGQQTLARVRAHFPGPLIVGGESLGAAVAAGVAADGDPLLLITPWDSLSAVASHHYPWLPASFLMRDRYDSAARLGGRRGHTLVVVAEGDAVIPARLGRRLHEAVGGASRLLAIPGAGHNDWADAVDERWWRQALGPLLETGIVIMSLMQ